MGQKEIFKKKNSVDWYNPLQLAKTGIKTVISSIFGNFNDKREIQAALNHESQKKSFVDYSTENEELWVDYISDTGDGFNATYTMAKLLAKPSLTNKEGITTKRGKILIMGGDQVYPTASREEYKNRLQGPYENAFPENPDDKNPPHLFAIPGNHDWYDGLTSFLKIFGQKRYLGNWRTQQARSYFALKLPHNVWLFGIDIQLNSDIDYNQLQYFKEIAECNMDEKSKIILCTAEPSWLWKNSKNTEGYNNLKHFESKIKEWSEATQVLTLAGDLHHYVRYDVKNGSYRITAGGGGAFTHPTQNMPEEIDGDSGDEMLLKKCFPSSKQSKKLLFRNLWFTFSSWRLSLFIGIIYSIFSSVLDSEDMMYSWSSAILTVIKSPISFLLLITLVLGLTLFSDNKPINPRCSKLTYSLFGFFHGLIQVASMIFCYWIVVRFFSFSISKLHEWISIQIGMVLGGFLLGGSVFGFYLILSNLIFKNHDNEAYSSLRWSGYKNFIRLHITKEQLSIYAYGVKNVVNWKEEIIKKEQTFNPSKEIEFDLIDNPAPIKLKNHEE